LHVIIALLEIFLKHCNLIHFGAFKVIEVYIASNQQRSVINPANKGKIEE